MMSRTKLGRRVVLAGGMAASLTPASNAVGSLGRDMTHTVVTHQDEKLVAADECHAPFRAAFLDWLQEASDRLMLPVSVWATSPRCTELKVPGLHPALEIALAGGTDINVYVSWKNVCWDILTSMDVYAHLAEDGSGWQNHLLVPDARFLHLTEGACWRVDGFEPLLEWLNTELARATHLALYGGDDCYEGDDWTAAYLARDGMLLVTGRPLASNCLRELLSLQENGPILCPNSAPSGPDHSPGDGDHE